MTFTSSGALLWTNWKGTVIQGEMLRVQVDLTVIICLGMKATKETSKGRGHTPIKKSILQYRCGYFYLTVGFGHYLTCDFVMNT